MRLNLIIDICNHSSSKEIISKNKKVDKGILPTSHIEH